MRRFFWIVPLLCSLAFGQGGVIGPNGVLGRNGVAAPGVSVAAVFTQIATTGTAGSFGSPYALTVSNGGAGIGATVVGLCTGDNDNAGTKFSWTVSDTRSNTWTFPQAITNASQQFLDASDHEALATMFTHVTTAILNGDTITFTPGVDGHIICTFYVVAGVTTIDQVIGNNTSFSATQTSSSITPSTSPTVGICLGAVTTFSAYGNVIGSAATGVVNQTGASGKAFVVEYRQLAATTAGTCTYTLTSSNNGAMLFVNYK